MRRSRDINAIFASVVEEIAALCARSKGGPRIPVVFTLPENDSININIILDDSREEREIKVEGGGIHAGNAWKLQL